MLMAQRQYKAASCVQKLNNYSTHPMTTCHTLPPVQQCHMEEMLALWARSGRHGPRTSAPMLNCSTSATQCPLLCGAAKGACGAGMLPARPLGPHPVTSLCLLPVSNTLGTPLWTRSYRISLCGYLLFEWDCILL